MQNPFKIKDSILEEYLGNDREIEIPDGVTSIGENAFRGCRGLKSVTIPDSVTSIGDKAFYYCENLMDITIPDSVSSVGKDAFFYTPWLENQPKGIIIAGKAVIGYTGRDTEIEIPAGITSIAEDAFSGCNGLTSITIPDSVTSIGEYAFARCENLKNMTIPHKVTDIGDYTFLWCRSLTNINIPDNVTTIGAGAFSHCESLKSLTIPESVKKIGERAFSNCISLENFTILGEKCKFGQVPFGPGTDSIPKGLKDQCFALIPHFTDGTLKEYILESDLWGTLTSDQQAEVFLSSQSKTLTAGYLKCITEEQLETLGIALTACLKQKPSAKECSAAVLYMTGFKEKIPTAKLQELYSLLKPVKAAAKALKEIEDDLVLRELLGQELTVPEGLAPAERLVMERLVAENKSQKDFEKQLKEYYGINYTDLPPVLGKDGNEKEPYVLAWLLQVHESYGPLWGNPAARLVTEVAYQKNEVCREAIAVLNELDEGSFQDALLALSKRFLAQYVNTKKKYLCYPICRYANEAVMEELTKEAVKWRTSVSGIDAPPLLQFREGCLYNNTRAAMLFAERYHDLDKYANIRGTDADTIRNTVLSEFGLDENGKKWYDIGNTVLEVELQDDLTLSLFDQKANKIVKSVPKRNADLEKYETAKADLADIRKNVKKVGRARNNALFNDFLNGKKYEPENWKKVHFSNPLLNRIARLLVWKQGESTFTLSAEGAIDHAGQTYAINSQPIMLAHPMEMQQTEIADWQKYFTKHGIKQPFAQMWEPVIDSGTVKKDRYSGIVLPMMKFKGKDKHGIIGIDFTAFSDSFDVKFTDCDLELDSSTWRLNPYSDEEYTYTLGEFTFQNYTRYTNHIVGILDGWTVEQRILKDDVSIVNNLESFTLAQITDFIKQASEHNCSNVTAALLEYKNNHFADYDPMEKFWLEDF